MLTRFRLGEFDEVRKRPSFFLPSFRNRRFIYTGSGQTPGKFKHRAAFAQAEGGSGGLPWEVDESLIDSAEHRALAREAAAASTVLASNSCDKATGKCALPILAAAPSPSADNGGAEEQAATREGGSLAGKTIAVLGPFGNCSDAIAGGWSKTNCYLHS
eukprot:COSAG06_NODE_4325_length_4365_cov_2.112518_8_plen_159_part_00